MQPVYTDPPPSPKQEVEDPCLQAGSLIGCQNRSLGEAVALGGTPYRLHYQSNRVAGTTGVNSLATAYTFDLGGWTLDVQHRYDPDTNTLFLSTGGFRSSESPGGVSPSSVSGYLIAAQDGLQVYEFDSNGVHIKTRHALNGATLLSFTYNSAGNLLSVTDGSNNFTPFIRNPQGKLMSMTAPYGQVSKVTPSKQGYLTNLKDPAGKSIKAKYSVAGLLISFTDLRGATAQFAFDSTGLLVSDKNASNGKQTLASKGDRVIHTSALGRITSLLRQRDVLPRAP